MSKEFSIKNSDGDFFQSQNWVLQLLAEDKITKSAFILYSFYRSLAGFNEIKCSYEFISLNSGLSKGAISSGNKLLKNHGLIAIVDNGKNHAYEIVLTPGSSLPRRELKKVEKKCSSNEQQKEKSAVHPVNSAVHPVNTERPGCSSSEQIYIDTKNILYKNNTTGPEKDLPVEYYTFIQYFKEYWSKMYKKPYRKKDFKEILKISKKDISSAEHLIPVLWSLDEADNWIRTSDHSITIFVKEFLSGRLQSYFPNTIHYYTQQNKINVWESKQ